MKPVTLLFVGLVSIFCGSMQATIELGISDGSKFPVPLAKAVFDEEASRSYVSLSQVVGGSQGNYAVSMINSYENEYRGIVPERMRIGSNYDQENPLYGALVRHLGLVEHAPFVVSQNELNKIYLIRNPGTSGTFLLESPIFTLDSGVDADEIVSIVGSPDKNFFYAVLNDANPFGTVGSTITVGSVGLDKEQKTIAVKQGETALFTVNSEAIKINNHLANISPEICMEISAHLQSCYTGLRVTAGGGAGSGARSVLMGLDIPMAPDAAILADSIIGSSVPGSLVSCYHIATMWATTGLDYLIVVGGVEAAAGDKDATVAALPLVGYGQGFGRLAKKNSKIETLVNSYDNKQVTGRAFSEEAAVAGDLFAANDQAVNVGGSIDLPGSILQLRVVKDTVFVTIADDGEVSGGVFSSTALFDGDGRISGWTNWTHAGGVAKQSVNAFLDSNNALWYSMLGDTWNDVTSVQRTEWHNADWIGPVDEYFTKDAHGIQGVFDFPLNHPAFSQNLNERISLFCLTGYQTVSLVQSGYTDLTGCYRPTDRVMAVAENKTTVGADAYVWNNGALAEIGAIITADIVSDGGYSWLVVGGSHGAAVLCRPDGSGWVTGSLTTGFGNLPPDMFWKRFYTSSAVRKVASANGCFFVLTEDQLLRYRPTRELFLGGGTASVVVANASELGATRFADFFVTGPLGFLGADNGLWRTGNGKDVVSVAANSAAQWKRIDLPESMISVTRLFGLSGTGISSDMASDPRGGHLYVISASVGRHSTSLYRFAIRPIDGIGVTSETVALFPDSFVVKWNTALISDELYRTYFAHRGDYRNHGATDGALWLFTRNSYAPTASPAFIEALPRNYRTMSNLGTSTSRAVFIAQNKGPGIGPLCQRSSNGAWLAGGSYLYGQN